MTYPRVNKGHIVPRIYQRNFADGDQIELHVVGEASGHVVNIAKAGTRQRPYRRTRPSGEEIDDIEWSLAHIEHAVAPILPEVEERWPLTLDDKRTLAEFFAVQMVRGPRFFDHRRDLVDEAMQSQKEELSRDLDLPERVIDHQVARAAERFRSDTDRLVSMLRLSRRITTHLGSMHWTLLRFDQPVIALSDQPVVIWPLGRERADAIFIWNGSTEKPTRSHSSLNDASASARLWAESIAQMAPHSPPLGPTKPKGELRARLSRHPLVQTVRCAKKAPLVRS